ncbi:CdiA C-terminal domain-containing protein [Actinokineospora iranica]|uniref:Heat-labile enterotoxin alpha chain n=1 Tax=Actinokineospora iranica TaxID=1271860 RepID=A0A1G6JVU8_9PSEU|nr:enterotoxin A family protein [Actinokineospora iranica]SDC22834.1 Heat-labile enterotoxin alpha chain [Actinokineospora iranica]
MALERADLSPAATGVKKLYYRDVVAWMRANNILWRGDSRSPEEISEAQGFRPHNVNDMNIPNHVGDTHKERGPTGYGYVSTSTEQKVGVDRSLGGGFLYRVRAPGGILTDPTMAAAGGQGRGENEVLFPGGIDWKYVEGWHKVTYESPDGFVVGEFVPNPDFIGHKLPRDFFNEPAPEHIGPDGAPVDRATLPLLSGRLHELPYQYEHLHKYRQNAYATPAGMSIFSSEREDRNAGPTANVVKEIPGTFVVDMHTGPDGAKIGKDALTADEVGELILANPDWKKPTPITLFGCDSGALPDGFAAQLSAKIGVEVHAPTTGMWVDNNGNAFATSGHKTYDGGYTAGWPPNGDWRTFSPDGTVVERPGPYPPGHTPSWGDSVPGSAPKTAVYRGFEHGPAPEDGIDIRAAKPDGHTRPSGESDPDALPQGPSARALDHQDAGTRRSLARDNESAAILAQAGYRVEQSAVLAGPKNPDLLIEGKAFDNYAPSGDKPANIASEIQRKVERGQADRVVLNVSDSAVDLDKMRAQLNDWPIAGLKEVLVIDKNGEITEFYSSETAESAPATDESADPDRSDDSQPEGYLDDRPDADSGPAPEDDEQAGDEPQAGPDSLPDDLRQIYDHSTETPAGRAFYGPDDSGMRWAANTVIPDPDRYTVDVHANANHAVVDGKQVTPSQLAAMVMADPNYQRGQAVRLVACEAGRDPDGFAARLARELGADVLASDKKVSTGSNARPLATDTYIDRDGKPRRTAPPNGRWHTFHPDGTRTESTGADGYPPQTSTPHTPPSDAAGERRDSPHLRRDPEAVDVRSTTDDPNRADETTPQSDDDRPPSSDEDPANRPRPANTLGDLPTADEIKDYLRRESVQDTIARANEIQTTVKVDGQEIRVGDAIAKMLPRHPEMVRMLREVGFLENSLLTRPEALCNLLRHPKAIDVLEDCVNEVRSHPDGPLALAEKYESDPKPPPAVLEPSQAELSTRTRDLVKTLDDGSYLQPAFDDLPVDHPDYRDEYLNKLYRDWETKQAMLHEFAAAVAAATGGDAYSRKEPKSKIRAKDKLGGKDPSKLVDLVGSKIQYDSVGEAYRGLSAVVEMSERDDSKIKVVAFDDRFAAPQSSGYRDLQMSVILNLGNGERHVAELRLHLKSIDEVADYEHALFEVRRDFKALAAAEGRANTADERALIGAILNVERLRFGYAFKVGKGSVPQ